VSRGERKAAKVRRRLVALGNCAPLLTEFAKRESTRGWDGRLRSVPRPAEAWAQAAQALLAWGLT